MIKLKILLTEELDTSKPFSTKDPASDGSKVWYTNDPWEYYLDPETEIWWTRKRGKGTEWLNMKDRITQDQYNQAMETLQAYIDKRNAIESKIKTTPSTTTSTTTSKTTTATKTTAPLANVDVQTPVVRGKQPDSYADMEMKEKPIEAGQRNYNVRVLGQTEDGEYLEVQLPKRGILNRKPIVYVKSDDFNVSADGKTATYNKQSGNKFDIYKAKRIRKRNKNKKK